MIKVLHESYAAQFTQQSYTEVLTFQTAHPANRFLPSQKLQSIMPFRTHAAMLKLSHPTYRSFSWVRDFSPEVEVLPTALQTADSMLWLWKHILCMQSFILAGSLGTFKLAVPDWYIVYCKLGYCTACLPVWIVRSSWRQFSVKVSAKSFKHSAPDVLKCTRLSYVYCMRHVALVITGSHSCNCACRLQCHTIARKRFEI